MFITNVDQNNTDFCDIFPLESMDRYMYYLRIENFPPIQSIFFHISLMSRDDDDYDECHVGDASKTENENENHSILSVINGSSI